MFGTLDINPHARGGQVKLQWLCANALRTLNADDKQQLVLCMAMIVSFFSKRQVPVNSTWLTLTCFCNSQIGCRAVIILVMHYPQCTQLITTRQELGFGQSILEILVDCDINGDDFVRLISVSTNPYRVLHGFGDAVPLLAVWISHLFHSVTRDSAVDQVVSKLKAVLSLALDDGSQLNLHAPLGGDHNYALVDHNEWKGMTVVEYIATMMQKLERMYHPRDRRVLRIQTEIQETRILSIAKRQTRFRKCLAKTVIIATDFPNDFGKILAAFVLV